MSPSLKHHWLQPFKKEQRINRTPCWGLPESSSAKAVFPEKTLFPICIFPGRKCGPSSLLSLQSLVRISVGLDVSLQALYPSLRSGGRTDRKWGWLRSRGTPSETPSESSAFFVRFPSHPLTRLYTWATALGFVSFSPLSSQPVKPLCLCTPLYSLHGRQGFQAAWPKDGL